MPSPGHGPSGTPVTEPALTGSEAGAEVRHRSLEGSGGVCAIAYRVIGI
ncbi:hypothetical protein [Streptomyces sp. NPDC048603]